MLKIESSQICLQRMAIVVCLFQHLSHDQKAPRLLVRGVRAGEDLVDVGTSCFEVAVFGAFACKCLEHLLDILFALRVIDEDQEDPVGIFYGDKFAPRGDESIKFFRLAHDGVFPFGSSGFSPGCDSCGAEPVFCLERGTKLIVQPCR